MIYLFVISFADPLDPTKRAMVITFRLEGEIIEFRTGKVLMVLGIDMENRKHFNHHLAIKLRGKYESLDGNCYRAEDSEKFVNEVIDFWREYRSESSSSSPPVETPTGATFAARFGSPRVGDGCYTWSTGVGFRPYEEVKKVRRGKRDLDVVQTESSPPKKISLFSSSSSSFFVSKPNTDK